MLQFTFQVPGDQAAQIDRVFTRFAKDVRAPFAFGLGRRIGADFLKVEDRHFKAQGGDVPGGRWAKLKPATLKQKKGGRILVESGKLESGLTSRSGAHVERIEDDEIELGINLTLVPWALFHQTGTLDSAGQRGFNLTRRGAPMRPPVELIEDDKRRWTNLIAKELVSRAKGL